MKLFNYLFLSPDPFKPTYYQIQVAQHMHLSSPATVPATLKYTKNSVATNSYRGYRSYVDTRALSSSIQMGLHAGCDCWSQRLCQHCGSGSGSGGNVMVVVMKWCD